MSATGFIGLMLLALSLQFYMPETESAAHGFSFFAVLVFGIAGSIQIGKGNL